MTETGRTLAYIEKDGDLIFHPDFFSKDPNVIKRMDNTLMNNEKVGWVPPGCGNRLFVLQHEKGHRVWWFIEEHHPELMRMISNIITHAEKIGDLRDFCEHSVSSGNISERFCDVFGAIYCMSPEDQPYFVKLIHQLLKQYKMPVKD